ncbi:UvrD-helicase domain-containing protein [Cerasicoccus maritimus]|uniref:UvrD-helicase domain-containing protein n=1 Tax=Cerasicoccus maritimus TaxID=490089 RepID=UPI002852B57F|nr:UvrD-helicase domain-containing protein [Cerasicoccus maritimus]
MTDNSQQISPAEGAARIAIDAVFSAIATKTHFRLEAGAGAGKTYSLIEALKMIVRENGARLIKSNQRVACITYTNVAVDEIKERIDSHPAVWVSTIHAFCWELVSGFQSALRVEVIKIQKWEERFQEVGGMPSVPIRYTLGYPYISDDGIYLHHSDVLKLIVLLMEKPKFRDILTQRFPVIFIDEYQDTDEAFSQSIVEYFVSNDGGPLVGLFGDSWQKIYREGAGLIENEKIKPIDKGANFRSVPEIVSFLNSIRPNLPQGVRDPKDSGQVVAFHTNNWDGKRKGGQHHGGDLPDQEAHDYLMKTCSILENDGWDFSPQKTKILMLTHNVLATEQSYKDLLSLFQNRDEVMKKENPYIAFFAEILEPSYQAYCDSKYGLMFSIINSKYNIFEKKSDKKSWVDSFKRIGEIRTAGTIGDMIEHLKSAKKPRLPESILEQESRLARATEEEINESSDLLKLSKMKLISFSQMSAICKFINNHTPYSTKHGVKGAEFENVLVVFGRGWNQYDWNRFLEWFPKSYSKQEEEAYQRNRNLFYVACSRPQRRLALLFTQKLSDAALGTLNNWIDKKGAIISL